MHLGQDVNHVDYHTTRSSPDDIDSILASAYNAKPTQQDRQHYPRAAANLDAFNQELLPLQGHQNQEVEPSSRQSNEPWAPLNSIILQPNIVRRLSGTGYVDRTGRNNMHSSLNPQMYGFNGTTNATAKAASDCGHALGDSGYGGSYGVISPATQSKTSRGDYATQSIFSGDPNHQYQESLSITGGLEGFDFHSQSTEIPQYDPFAEEYSEQSIVNAVPEPNQAAAAAAATAMATIPDGPPWNCTQCDAAPFKNKSEHKFVLFRFTMLLFANIVNPRKHMLRHSRPYKCDHLNCNRQNLGFSTRNDLDRHRKSVHKIAPETSTDKTYMCVAATCRHKKKVWPRADNFRQHCVRLHGDIDIEYLIRKSLVPSDLAGFARQGRF